MHEGAEVPEERYTRGRNVARQRLDGYVSARAPAGEMGRGASLVFFSVDDWFGPARKLRGVAVRSPLPDAAHRVRHSATWPGCRSSC
jgi:hypothetical protein